MVEARVVGHLIQAADRTGLRVGGSEHHPPDPAVHDGPGAHGARLEGDVEVAVVEAPVPHSSRCIAQREHLGMRRGVAGEFAFVVAGGDDVPVAHHDRADRHVAVRLGTASLVERLQHRSTIHGGGGGI